MRCIRLTIAYDGAAYAGWQVQLNQPTVQAAIEAAILQVTGETVRVTASGRTDSGVHALGQVAGFHTQSELSPQVFQRAINAHTPDDITILAASEAPSDFHAIRDAIKKRYRYVLQDGRLRDVFARQHAWFVPHPLDDQAMHRAAQSLVGTHDFVSYAAKKFDALTSVRTIFDLSVSRQPTRLLDEIVLEVEANGFLYHMVRNIVGTLVEVGRGAKSEQWPLEVLNAQTRQAAGMTAPPQGLFLVQVDYEINRCLLP